MAITSFHPSLLVPSEILSLSAQPDATPPLLPPCVQIVSPTDNDNHENICYDKCISVIATLPRQRVPVLTCHKAENALE